MSQHQASRKRIWWILGSLVLTTSIGILIDYFFSVSGLSHGKWNNLKPSKHQPKMDSERPARAWPNEDGSQKNVASVSTEISLIASIRKLSKLPYSRERQFELSEAGMSLGRALGLKRSMEIISDIFGPGKDRIWMINSITMGTLEPMGDVLAFARNLEYSDDADACLAGFAMLVLSRSDFSFDEFSRLSPPLSREEVRTVINGVAARGSASKGEFESSAKATVDFIKKSVNVHEREDLASEFFSTASETNPRGALNGWLDASVDLNASFVDAGFFQQNILAAALRSDPENSIHRIEAVLEGGDPKARGRLAASVVQQWMQIDTNAAVAWATSADMHGPIVKSAAIAPLFEQALRARDFATAKRWLDLIEDPQMAATANSKFNEISLQK